ncbi:hypothetical protein [Anaerosalibacter sp. Marseille-P3206]|uniref:hypothetical protein n=1 Tax=Anaerosalibacter sp. Marseille-P3206 TaxID=1871005 RepID=UPI000987B9D1|nr:hypothetical protein [Anaerosalibacter sp. Marseille-P3206]
MKYTNMINPIEGFKYSANIRYDLMQDNSILQYIPTQNSLKIFRDIFNDITNGGIGNKQASRLIYGSYGTGKSHLMTILASILGKLNSEKAYSIFEQKVACIDHKLAKDIHNYLDISLPFIIVPIDGSFNKFHECIYYSLTRALDEKKINYKLKDPYIEATQIIKNWKKEGNSDFYQLLEDSFSKYEIYANDLVTELMNFNPKALEIFKNIFYDITCGVEYRPKPGNLYENLDYINSVILKQGYRGIIFIFDEFGKYLEDNIKGLKVKTIQDFAEYCDHSNFENYFLLISHKQLLQYVEADDRDEWEKIESRFQPVSFEQSVEDTMYLISNVLIKKEPIWSKFVQENSDYFQQILNETLDIGFYKNLSKNDVKNLLYGNYPLHPIVGQTLNILSKKIAQNERTIFTFLASEEENSLGDFLIKYDVSDFHFVGADLLYDYFEENLTKNKSSFEYSEWLEVKNSINKLNKKDDNYHLKVKIIKSIGIINIVNDFDILKPDDKTLSYIIDDDEQAIVKAINEMLQNKIIIYLRQYKYYRFFDVSSVDIEGLISQTMEISDNTAQAVELLNRRFTQFPVLPDKYNEKYKMIRYYYPIYILDSEINELEKLLNKKYYDGLLVYVITKKSKEEILSELNGERIIYVLRDNSFEIMEELKKLIAIEYLLTQEKKLKKEDPKSIVELVEYKKEVETYINNYTIEWANPAQEDVCYVEDEKVLEKINSTGKLSEYMSREMFKYFDRTLIINNELINKNKLSNPMIKARKEICNDLLLQEEMLPSLGYKELSTNHTFIRSLLELNGILKESEIVIPELDNQNLRLKNTHYTMKEIDTFIRNAEKNEINLGDIFHILKSKPYGLRDGYIVVLLAASLRQYKHNALIRLKGIDQELSGDLFDRIAKYPNQYTLIIQNWDKEKEGYILFLERKYHNYIDEYAKKKNRLKALHDGILSHYKSISKFGRTTVNHVKESTIKYRKIIEMETENYRDFFFNKLNELGKDYIETGFVISDVKKDLECADIRLIISTEKVIREVFKLEKNKGIATQFLDLYKKRWKKRVEFNLNYLTGKFIRMLETMDINMDDIDIVKQMGLLITGFQFNYWSDEQSKEFINSLKEIYNDLEKSNDNFKLEDGDIKIILEDEDGTTKRVKFNREELPDNGQILKNLISTNIENFGQALSHDMKRQVLYEVLMKYI